MINYFSDSAKRLAIFQEQLSADARYSRLKKLCETRFSDRYNSLKVAITSLETIFASLEAVESDRKETAKTRSTATGVLNSIHNFEFFVTIFFVKDILAYTDTICKTVQRVEVDLI